LSLNRGMSLFKNRLAQITDTVVGADNDDDDDENPISITSKLS